MRYYEVLCEYAAGSGDFAEMLIAELAELGFESFTEGNGEVMAYITEDSFSPSLLDEVFVAKDQRHGASFSWKLIEEENWNKEWESNFQPVVVGNQCIVRAPFHDKEGSFDYDIIVEPKMSFGTGHHETTQLMLEELLATDCEGKTVVDCGCGTGVLAIMAFKRGASKTKGFDVEPWACENTEENFERNGITDGIVECKGVESISGEVYDIVLANINRNILVGSMPQFAQSMHAGSTLLLSGFYRSDIDIITQAATSNGLSFISSREKNNWVACRFTKL